GAISFLAAFPTRRSSDLTSGVNLHPQYRYVENQAPAITGYQASNTVSVKLREVARIGKVLDALVANGANQINGPSFGIDKPEPLYDKARIDALKLDRKSTRLNSSHVKISYAVFCLKKKKQIMER